MGAEEPKPEEEDDGSDAPTTPTTPTVETISPFIIIRVPSLSWSCPVLSCPVQCLDNQQRRRAAAVPCQSKVIGLVRPPEARMGSHLCPGRADKKKKDETRNYRLHPPPPPPAAQTRQSGAACSSGHAGNSAGRGQQDPHRAAAANLLDDPLEWSLFSR